MAMSNEDKARESRVRRFAVRQRYTLAKSRVRDRRAWSYGRYWLIHQDGEVIGGRNGVCYAPPGLILAEAERWLTSGD